jgi:hypothetical protein
LVVVNALILATGWYVDIRRALYLAMPCVGMVAVLQGCGVASFRWFFFGVAAPCFFEGADCLKGGTKM